MTPQEFKELRHLKQGLTPEKRRLLADDLQKASSTPNPVMEEIVRWGRVSGLQRYRCRACHRQFAPLTHTPLSGLRKRGTKAPGTGMDPEHYPERQCLPQTRLKEWLERFHGVATKDLPHYLGWSRFLELKIPSAPSPGRFSRRSWFLNNFIRLLEHSYHCSPTGGEIT